MELQGIHSLTILYLLLSDQLNLVPAQQSPNTVLTEVAAALISLNSSHQGWTCLVCFTLSLYL